MNPPSVWNLVLNYCQSSLIYGAEEGQALKYLYLTTKKGEESSKKAGERYWLYRKAKVCQNTSSAMELVILTCH